MAYESQLYCCETLCIRSVSLLFICTLFIAVADRFIKGSAIMIWNACYLIDDNAPGDIIT